MSREMVLIAKANINGLNVYLFQGSCINLPADCLVNAANENLKHGGGLALEISQQAGNQFDAECNEYIRRKGPIPSGGVAVTNAHNLRQFKKIIHAVGPKEQDNREKSNMLISTLVNSFKVAAEHGFSSISVPALSVGIFNYPKDISAIRHFEAVYVFAQQSQFYPSLKDIGISLFKDDEARIFADIFVEMSHLFPVFEYYGTVIEQGKVIGRGYCTSCQRSFDDYCFEFTNVSCRCKSTCDFCIGKKRSGICFQCGNKINNQFIGLSKCGNCSQNYSIDYSHQCS